MTSVKENLIAAKALIDTPEKWIKGELHEVVGARHCYCIYGALAQVVRTEEDDAGVVGALRAVAPHRYLSVFNDAATTTHADIMALFQRAIDAEEAKEAQS